VLETLVAEAADDPDSRADLAAPTPFGNRSAPNGISRPRSAFNRTTPRTDGAGNLPDGEEERAIGLLQRAVKSAPNAFEPRYLLGSAYNRLGRYREALAELQARFGWGR
jgi:tetratricopeptide (TPR) repeat protein